MQVALANDDLLGVGDAVAVSITQHDQISRLSLRDVHGAVIGDRQHARIVQTLGEALYTESLRHSQRLNARVRR